MYNTVIWVGYYTDYELEGKQAHSGQHTMHAQIIHCIIVN